MHLNLRTRALHVNCLTSYALDVRCYKCGDESKHYVYYYSVLDKMRYDHVIKHGHKFDNVFLSPNSNFNMLEPAHYSSSNRVSINTFILGRVIHNKSLVYLIVQLHVKV